MRIRHIIVLPAAALALAVGSAYADDKRSPDYPNFNTMDRNNDGALTRSEAAANPKLADQFAQVDSDNDGRLSRGEYLAIMGRQDLYNLRENLAEFINPEGKAPLAQGGGASSGGTQAASQKQQGGDLPARAASPQLIRNVQQALEKQGVDAGPVDGIWGPRTHAGIAQFQKQQGLEATGQINARTLEALGIEGGQSASAGGGSAASMFEKADQNDDGYVSREEFNSTDLASSGK